MDKSLILGIRILDNNANTEILQDILTRYGCVIRTRLGLPSPVHDPAGKGLILLELSGEDTEKENLEKALKRLDWVEVKKMEF